MTMNNFFMPFSIMLMGSMGLILNKSNLMQVLVSFELISVGIILMLSLQSMVNFAIFPLMLAVLLTVVSASEVALGLILVMTLNKVSGSMNMGNFINNS